MLLSFIITNFLELAIMLCSSHQRVTSSMVFCSSDLLFVMGFGVRVNSSVYFTPFDDDRRNESIFRSQNIEPVRVPGGVPFLVVRVELRCSPSFTC